MTKLTKKQKLATKLGDNQKLHGRRSHRAAAAWSAKFDETLEISLNLGVDPPRRPDGARHGDAAQRHRQGREGGVFARGDKADAALAAGADKVGAEDLLEDIQAGNRLTVA
jgi:large subunit ribosomal protein L1